MERWVPARGNIIHVDGQEEGEAKERDVDEIDQSDGDQWCDRCGSEGSKIDGCEPYDGRKGVRGIRDSSR